MLFFIVYFGLCFIIYFGLCFIIYFGLCCVNYIKMTFCLGTPKWEYN